MHFHYHFHSLCVCSFDKLPQGSEFSAKVIAKTVIRGLSQKIYLMFLIRES